MAKRRSYTRDVRGRFATTQGSNTRRSSSGSPGSSSKRGKAVTAALATAGTLGALYATDGKGAYRTAGLLIAGGSGIANAARNRKKRRR